MKRVGLVSLGCLLLSLAAHAGHFFTNDTGVDATGLRVVFSEPVSIDSFGDAFTEVAPSGAAREFVFSGGVVPPWGGVWFSQTPTTASVERVEWMHSAFSGVPSASSQDLVYSYLSSPRQCHSATPTAVPVYVSVPYLTPAGDTFALEVLDGGIVVLERVDEVNLVGRLPLYAIPAAIRVRLLRNGFPVQEFMEVVVENGFQAVTIGVASLPDVPSSGQVGGGFLQGAVPHDTWGNVLYAAGEAMSHTREFFGTVCDRMADLGVGDVYVATYMQYTSIAPLPQMGMSPDSGAGCISEADLRTLVEEAHSRGLRFHLLFGIGWDDSADPSLLWQSGKSDKWFEAWFSEYEGLLVEEVGKAERSGVDAVVLNCFSGTPNVGGSERAWRAGWPGVIRSVRDAFSGKVEYIVTTPAERDGIMDGLIPGSVFDGVDAFLYAFWLPGVSTTNTSIASLHMHLERFVNSLRPLKAALGRPLYYVINWSVTEDYFSVTPHGDFAWGVGVAESDVPGFFVHARAHEALLQVVSGSDVLDGIISWSYNWDDPFGPDMDLASPSRFDMFQGVRNKPAEAILKKWFGGSPGPSLGQTTEEERTRMNRLWCPAGCAAPIGLTRDVSELPYLFTYGLQPQISYWCDADTAISNAQYWKLPGCQVKGVKAAVLDDAVLVGVDLHEEDTFGNYRYIVGLNFTGGRVLVFLDPRRRLADVAYDFGGQWTWIAVLTGCQFGTSDRSVSAILPIDVWQPFVSRQTLGSSRVDFHIDYEVVGRRELFIFASPTRSPTTYVGSAFQPSGEP